MAGTGAFNDALALLAARLATISGVPVVRDPRNIAPGCILISAPSLEFFTGQVAAMRVPLMLISSGPGNLDALDQLLGIVAKVAELNVGATVAIPTSVNIGGTDAPAYEMTINLAGGVAIP
jgi:hypothetical protein